MTPDAHCGERVELTWRERNEEEFFDTLVVNQTEIPHDIAVDFVRLKKFFEAHVPDSEPQSILVTFPDGDAALPSFPRLPGGLKLLLSAATSPERQVQYTWRGRTLKRYCIRCSSKGTGSDPESANYWFDGEALGPWEKARNRFMEFGWQKGAIVDILFDSKHILEEGGMGLFLLPELEEVFREHEIFVNEHVAYRAIGER